MSESRYPTKRWIKDNLIRLAIDHKAKCNNKNCNIQLVSLFVVCKRLKIRLSKKEREAFI